MSGVEVGQQTTRRPQRQGQLAEAQAIEAGQAEVTQQPGPGLGGLEGGAGQGRESLGVGAPGGGRRCSVGLAAFPTEGGRGRRAHNARFEPGPHHLGGLQLQQLLVQGAAPLPLGDPELAGAHIGHRQPPTAAAAQHHGAEPVVASGGEHALLEHRAGGEHPGDVAAQQGPLGGGGLELVAEGHAEAAAHQLSAVALGGVVGDARHRHPADALAALLAGEGELQQAREQQGIFEEELVEVAEAVEQHALRMGRLELHVVTQHRAEGGRVHQAVVVPAGQVGLGLGVAFVGGVLAFTGSVSRAGAAAGLGFCDRSPGRRRARCGGDGCRPRCCIRCYCGRRSTTPFHPLLRAPSPGGRVPPPSGPGCRIGLQELVGVEGFGLLATGCSRRQRAGCGTSGSPPRGPRSGFPRRRRRFGKQTPLQPRPHQLGNQGQLLFGWRRHGTGGGGGLSYETPPMGSNTGSLPRHRPPPPQLVKDAPAPLQSCRGPV